MAIEFVKPSEKLVSTEITASELARLRYALKTAREKYDAMWLAEEQAEYNRRMTSYRHATN